jgi:putative PIN family toxin of toxin-antitoxin system
MRVVLDTNVFVSGIFFAGPPYQILKAWQEERLDIVASSPILEEYRGVGKKLSDQFPGIDLTPILELVAARAMIIEAMDLAEPVCDDPDDDKFMACALSGRAQYIVSGDKHLLKISGCQGLKIVTPRKFLDNCL